MSSGMSRLFKRNKTGLTMVELMIATLLLSVIFLAISSLYLVSQKFYITATQKIIIGYEVQYAIQHIYKNAMIGFGDKNTPSFRITGASGENQLDININSNDPLTAGNYSSVTSYRYYKSDNTLMFDKGTPLDNTDDESLVPKVTVTAVSFTESGNALTGYITAKCGIQDETLTFYFACYPRLASFN